MTITEFERRILEQKPTASTPYDAEYFTGEWRDAGNNYSLDVRRGIEDHARTPRLEAVDVGARVVRVQTDVVEPATVLRDESRDRRVRVIVLHELDARVFEVVPGDPHGACGASSVGLTPEHDVVLPDRRLDVLHRESLETLLAQYKITSLSDADKDHITRAWHRLKPWPDTVEGLKRLKTRYIIGTLSNGNVGLLTRLAKNAGLPWDVILGAETARAYKPMPEAYARTAMHLNLKPAEVMLAAAHNGDLTAAAAVGLRTAFIVRPTEYGPKQQKDFKAERAWDVITDGFIGLADAMGCARY